MGKDSVPKKSTMSTVGLCFMEETEDLRFGRTSRIITAICVTTAAFGSTRPEMSTGGRSMMLQSLGLMEECRTWASSGDAWELTTKIVTTKLWWVTRRFPSSRTGMRWPVPGLESSAACGLEISMDVNVEK